MKLNNAESISRIAIVSPSWLSRSRKSTKTRGSVRNGVHRTPTSEIKNKIMNCLKYLKPNDEHNLRPF